MEKKQLNKIGKIISIGLVYLSAIYFIYLGLTTLETNFEKGLFIVLFLIAVIIIRFVLVEKLWEEIEKGKQT